MRLVAVLANKAVFTFRPMPPPANGTRVPHTAGRNRRRLQTLVPISISGSGVTAFTPVAKKALRSLNCPTARSVAALSVRAVRVFSGAQL
ncbi:hypothetical protein D3C77_588890 [compost metagenome]